MTTAAIANDGTQQQGSTANESTGNSSSVDSSAKSKSTPSQNQQQPKQPPQALRKTALLARGLADDASRAIGNLLPTATLQNITARKYTLPDKTVASQVLMYRQLLHTSCRPGLKLSRPYQATAAQKTVMHMPWWERGIEESKKMVISYDNLISRLWLNGAILPFQPNAESGSPSAAADDEKNMETFMGDDGLPPVPHEFWVERLGFQQTDPVTDFRSGGVLSLGMIVYMVESCPEVCERFFSGDASVLPFGITCINVTDMIAKFLMLAKSTDKMDALLSQKPFWKMFGDPNAILTVQELAMTMLCDVVVELGKERQVPGLSRNDDNMQGDSDGKVTVFDFSMILERTERRVRDDLLGAGPKTVSELRSVAGRLKLKYQHQLERRIQKAEQQNLRQLEMEAAGITSPQNKMNEVMAQAGNMAGGFFSKMRTGPGFNLNKKKAASLATQSAPIIDQAPEPAPTIVALPPAPAPAPASAAIPSEEKPAAAPSSGGASSDADWLGTDIASATDAISNFSIGDDDDSL
eukprot:CAMPEP_0119549904 /NCGR_PEP_ID=MMETSP1352-20130426/3532_1 /TAXON_ID=265584 /ORGANISM="Stauroneis constricta, Strain CCMP1120" /LENGTH=523 /DNA_ID=CAMNT_0007595603 /DNA_START=1036 /DNA_END=2607 /DNA_ORIENTATION=+